MMKLIILFYLKTKDGAEDMFESVSDALDTTAATTSPGEGEQLINKTDLTLSVEKDSKETFLNKSVITRKGMSLQFDNESLSNVTSTNMELQVIIKLNCICSEKKLSIMNALFFAMITFSL